MPTITYIEHAGESHTVEVATGDSVMEGARGAGVPGIPAECGGACACSTCHVHVEENWYGRLPSMQSMEEDMLDFAPHVIAGRSRLSCQIRVTPQLDGLVVTIPAEQA